MNPPPTKPRVYYIDAAYRTTPPELDIESEILSDIADLIFVGAEHPHRLPEQVFEAQALIVTTFPQMTRELLKPFSKLRMIVRNGVGYDNIDADAARDLGIPVCNVPDYGTEEVADHALLLSLALQRKLYAAIDSVRGGAWNWRVTEPVRRARGQRFGIVGCGRIGTAAALRAKAFGFTVQFYDPYVASGYEKGIGVERCSSLTELLQTSDVVSLHCPLSAATRGMIGYSEMLSMKPGAFLVNTARGPLVPEADLLRALKTGHLGGAALDVMEHEPECDPELFVFPNCIITPHIAFYSAEALADMRSKAACNVRDCLRGLDPINVVNPGPPRN